MEHVRVGKLGALGVTDAKRSAFLPELPTFKEAGYDIQGTGWYGVFAPAKTPPDMVERLNKAIVTAVQAPAVKERLLALGLQPTGTSARIRRRTASSNTAVNSSMQSRSWRGSAASSAAVG